MDAIFLVRHAEAAAGPSRMDRDFFLTPRGERQARALGRQLKALGVAPFAIVHSRLTRARQTAEFLAKYLPAPLYARGDLIEHGARVLLEDCAVEEAARRFPDALDASGAVRYVTDGREGLHRDFSTGGETLRALHERARAAWTSILAEFGSTAGTCLLVSHGCFLSSLIAEILGLPLQPVWHAQFANAAYLWLRLYPGKEAGQVHPVLSFPGPAADGPAGWERNEPLVKD